MIRAVIAAMSWLVVAAVATDDAGAQQAIPNSPGWQMAYEADMCVLSRAYATKSGEFVFGIRSTLPGVDMVGLQIVTEGMTSRKRERQLATISVPGQDQLWQGEVTLWPAPKLKQTLILGSVPRTLLTPIAAAQEVTIAVAGQEPVTLPISAAKQALKALEACEADFAKTLGIDAAQSMNVKTPAEPAKTVGDWIRFEDYPKSALQAGVGGTVSILWEVDKQGKIASCRTIKTSGREDLDKAACDALMKRARFNRPALDAAGNPVASYGTRQVVWAIP
ncbi:energy transducer TonB [Sphingomonas sp. BGYR3]|uniref:energy transducer TonB n=1 Tax=Sphingomonas sp. BGYR3 TaxID=2975483 RepID=UPI0021A38345|nr:energy transducer TonB [Sphingomonas sp. BGYR3]MDG5489297.1 energy transducer TonB [Sphingomonas sp. BGYR3]